MGESLCMGPFRGCEEQCGQQRVLQSLLNLKYAFSPCANSFVFSKSSPIISRNPLPAECKTWLETKIGCLMLPTMRSRSPSGSMRIAGAPKVAGPVGVTVAGLFPVCSPCRFVMMKMVSKLMLLCIEVDAV